MDNKQKLIEKIKNQLKSLIGLGDKEVKLASVKAGELIITSPDEELTIGSEVSILDNEGVGMPMSDGKYVLDSGVEIVVEAGKVKEMMKADEKDESESEVEVTIESGSKEEMKEMGKMKDEKEMGYGYDNKMAADMETKVAQLEEKVMALIEKMNMIVGDAEMMKKEMSAFANSPATEPITTKSVEFRSVEEKKSDLGMPDIQTIREKARKNNR
jgi:hypothetical protein